jgi:hypothetical protein
LDLVDGLEPSQSKHESYITLEPVRNSWIYSNEFVMNC